jgi:peptidoglycan-associated lipoprotein
MEMKLMKGLMVLAIALGLSACGSKKLDDTPVDSAALENGQVTQVNLADKADKPMTFVIYYEFDKSDVPADVQELVQQHVAYMTENPRKRLELQGHADERGSRDYNLALGERRAKGVYQMMVVLGAGPAKISTVTFGEERPASEAHNEAAWALNRRVEFIYR